MRAARALVLGGLLLASSGCATAADVGVDADCGDAPVVDNRVLILMAQAVPTASMIPCVELVPASWRHGDVDVRSGRAVFEFASGSVDSPESVPLTVRLTRTCDVTGATEVPTDEPGTRRWERLRSVSPSYVGQRFYVFEGGCVTLTFALSGAAQAQAVGEGSLAVGFVNRNAVRVGVGTRSDGRLKLDPDPPGGAGG